MLATPNKGQNAQVVPVQAKVKAVTNPPSDARPILQDKKQPTTGGAANANPSPAAVAAVQAMLAWQKQQVAGQVWTHHFPCHKEMSLYASLATDKRIDSFLTKTPTLWDRESGCWVGFDKTTRLKDGVDLTDMVFNIIGAVIKEWGLSNRDGASRRVRKATDTKLYHKDQRRGLMRNDYSSPSLVIEAQGPSFGLPPKRTGFAATLQPEADIGFATITTCITVRMLAHRLTPEETSQLQAVYARQIFIQQPNRRFVRTLSVTEHAVRFFHFDRSGFHDEVFIDWEDTNPYDFIRLILGLTSLDEEVLGFDTSLQWSVDSMGRKASGTLTTTDDESNITKTYDLVSLQPIFQPYFIFGRGTVCWDVRDPETGEVLLVKDCWREESCKPEYENLKAAKNLPGVVQMIAYEDNRAQTRDFGVSQYLPPGKRAGTDVKGVMPPNLIQSRIVMERYGRRVGQYMSEKDTLCALRDAIAGHMQLYLVGEILHCDFATLNVVLGKPGAEVGNRGILIDLDLARPICDISEENIVGHALNFSLSLLANGTSYKTRCRALPHDYLDDLESSFYTTTQIMCEDEGPKKRPNPRPTPGWVREWYASAVGGYETNLQFKQTKFILSKPAMDPTGYVAPYWSKVSRHLLKRFYMFTRKIAKEKEKIRWCEDGEKAEKKRRKLLSRARQHYSHVLYLFDEAIRELDASNPGTKRKAEEEPVEELGKEPRPGRRTRRRRA
ncbi:hypothetical protein EST38_g11144 [Candolleomyces aberdarensis]|uniref:Fungal-type protein kinase domain-containing protein n=1 Tax=Candolleomyces aberdarensis TaxID=2316362 RepID=A0A4V1Q2D5_9AGAR|nr:hypothetical protein EST38_g11144 [Candolleomyces aberdarensis]